MAVPRPMFYQNPCDRLRDTLQDQNLPIWGFAIYRCTYADDSAWERLVDSLKENVREQLADYEAVDLLQSFELDIREDREKSGNVTPEQTRKQFQAWVLSHGRPEPPPSGLWVEVKANSHEKVYVPLTTRHSFCVHVDSAALNSVIKYLDGDKETTPYVTLINAMHGLLSPPREEAEEESDDEIEGDDLDDEDLGGYIREVEEEPLGYMRISFSTMMPAIYTSLHDWSDFDRVYRKPPEIWKGGASYASGIGGRRR